jgi:hypothetical protein
VTRNLSHATKDQNKDLIIQTVKKEKPETAKQLITLMQERHAISFEQIASLLIELENENRFHFTKQEALTPASTKEYVFSKQATWYWATIIIAFATAITVFTIPDTAYPVVYFRWGLGTIFLLFLPGFTLIKALFPAKMPIKTTSENMDTIERTGLSFGLSLVLVPVVGLILNYTPWGIRLTPITLSLLASAIFFATAGILREYLAKAQSVKISHSS